MNTLNALQPSGNVERITPEPLTDEISAPNPYPVEAMPPMLKDAVQAIANYVQAPTALAGQCVLNAVAHLAQTRVDASASHRPSGQMPCSLFTLALGDSGDRKTSAEKIAFKPIANHERELKTLYQTELEHWRKEADKLTGKELKEYLKDNPKPEDPSSLITSDASYSTVASILIAGKAALSWSTDEGGQMLGGHSMKADNFKAVLGGLTRWFDSGEGERVRAKDNADGSGTAYGRRLGMSLLAQEIVVRDALQSPVIRGQGFLPRFLFTAPQSLKGTRFIDAAKFGTKPEDDPRIMAYWERLQKLMAKPEPIDGLTHEIKAPCLGWTPEARALWCEFFNHTEAEQARLGTYESMSAFASRAGEIAARVATVLAFFCERDHVDGEAMKAAIALADHSLKEWLRYGEAVQIDPITDGAIRCMEWLKAQLKAGKYQWRAFTKDQWGKAGFKPYRPAKVRDPVLGLLAHKGHLIETNQIFTINSLLLGVPSAESAESAEAQQYQALPSAEEVRTSAENSSSADKSAPIRTLSANANPHEIRLSAQSAQSAPTAWKGAL